MFYMNDEEMSIKIKEKCIFIKFRFIRKFYKLELIVFCK